MTLGPCFMPHVAESTPEFGGATGGAVPSRPCGKARPGSELYFSFSCCKVGMPARTSDSFHGERSFQHHSGDDTIASGKETRAKN